MADSVDAAYVTARKALLDVLDVLGPHLKSVILVGAQAIYVHTGEVEFAVSPFTYDADLAINRWHGDGTSNKYPSSAGLRKGWNQKMSTYFVEDGSFFRIQNVQLAYNIKGVKLFGADMPETKVSFTADRPLTLFKYNGFNPEVANGIDTQTYPIPAVYTVGLAIKF